MPVIKNSISNLSNKAIQHTKKQVNAEPSRASKQHRQPERASNTTYKRATQTLAAQSGLWTHAKPRNSTQQLQTCLAQPHALQCDADTPHDASAVGGLPQRQAAASAFKNAAIASGKLLLAIEEGSFREGIRIQYKATLFGKNRPKRNQTTMSLCAACPFRELLRENTFRKTFRVCSVVFPFLFICPPLDILLERKQEPLIWLLLLNAQGFKWW